MGNGGKGTGEDRDARKGLGNDVHGGCTGSAPVWDINMGGNGRDGEVTGRFSP